MFSVNDIVRRGVCIMETERCRAEIEVVTTGTCVVRMLPADNTASLSSRSLVRIAVSCLEQLSSQITWRFGSVLIEKVYLVIIAVDSTFQYFTQLFFFRNEK